MRCTYMIQLPVHVKLVGKLKYHYHYLFLKHKSLHPCHYPLGVGFGWYIPPLSSSLFCLNLRQTSLNFRLYRLVFCIDRVENPQAWSMIWYLVLYSSYKIKCRLFLEELPPLHKIIRRNMWIQIYGRQHFYAQQLSTMIDIVPIRRISNTREELLERIQETVQ